MQLINKTNQFNLTTRRYGEEEVRALLGRPEVSTWQLRLRDKFGDNGMIACVIAVLEENGDLRVDTWLMSCRVLGRTVEEATFNLLLERARALGARRLTGEYRPRKRTDGGGALSAPGISAPGGGGAVCALRSCGGAFADADWQLRRMILRT